MPRRFSNNGFGGQDPLTYWCATESEAWELLRCSRKNSQCQGRRCKQQLHILRGRRVELSRGSQPSRKWRARRFCNTKRHVSCQPRGCPRAESKSREVGHTPTRVFGQRMKVYGQLMEHGEVVHHPKVVDEGDELARRFVIRASAREALEEHATSEAIRRAAATRFPVDEDIRARYSLFLLQTPPRQTSGNGNARTTSGTHGFDWTSRSKWLVRAVWWTGILVPLNTCEESHRTKRIAWASMETVG